MKLLFITLLILCVSCSKESQNLTVYSASSLIKPITEIIKLFEKEKGIKIDISFSNSANLAQKIKKSNSADIFFSANYKWVKFLKDKKRLFLENSFLRNSLTLVSKNDLKIESNLDNLFSIEKYIDNCLVIGNPKYVPAGKYAEEFLTSTNQLNKIPKEKVVYTQDAVSILNYLKIGKCDIGITYKTDAILLDNFKTVIDIPQNTHKEIIYTMVLTKDNENSKELFNFFNSKKSKDIFTKYQFIIRE